MINKDELNNMREELKDVIDLIDSGIELVKIEARSMSCDPVALRTPNGGWVLQELLANKVKAFHALLIIDVLESEVEKGN
jgi:hypothetical protein